MDRNRGKKNEGKLFSAKPETDQTRTLAQKFLSFFGFGKPVNPKRSSPSRSKARTVQKHPVKSERLFVGNLSYSVKESDLAGFFKEAGKVVSAEVVTNRQTHRSKGFGFVTMGSISEAERAVAQLDGKSLSGRDISVSGAKSDGKKDGAASDRSAPKKQRQQRSEGRPPRGRDGRNESRDRGGRGNGRSSDGGRRREGGGRGRKTSSSPMVVPMAVEEVSSPYLSMGNLSDAFGSNELEHLLAGVAKVAKSEIVDGVAEIEMASIEDAQTAVRLLDGKDFMGSTLSLSSKATAEQKS